MGRELERKQRDFEKAVETEQRIDREADDLNRQIRVAEVEGHFDTANTLKRERDRMIERSRDARSDVEDFRRVMQDNRGL